MDKFLEVKMINLDKFDEWFNKRLRIRAYPNILDIDNKYILGNTQILINVSNSFKPDVYEKIKELGIEYFWFPMNERTSDIGLNSIYGACSILYNSEKRK